MMAGLKSNLEYQFWPFDQYLRVVNPFQPNLELHIETSCLICHENQMAGFCMEYNTWLKWVNFCDSSIYIKGMNN